MLYTTAQMSEQHLQALIMQSQVQAQNEFTNRLRASLQMTVPSRIVALSVLSGPKRDAEGVPRCEADRLETDEVLGPATDRKVSAAVTAIIRGPWFSALLARFPRAEVIEYARFIVLKRLQNDVDPPPKLSPSGPVDVIWHAHMLLPQDYAPMSVAVFGPGKYMYHDPNTANDTIRADRYLLTIGMYESIFGRVDAKMWPHEPDVRESKITRTITIKESDGQQKTVPYPEDMTVGNVQDIASDMIGKPKESIRVVYAGKSTNDATIVLSKKSDFCQTGIHAGATIYVVSITIIKASPISQIFVKTLTNETLALPFEDGNTVLFVKGQIQGKIGTPADSIRLIYRGIQLEDEKTMADYRITKQETLHMVLRLRGC